MGAIIPIQTGGFVGIGSGVRDASHKAKTASGFGSQEPDLAKRGDAENSRKADSGTWDINRRNFEAG